jgi:hypothetical protein
VRLGSEILPKLVALADPWKTGMSSNGGVRPNILCFLGKSRKTNTDLLGGNISAHSSGDPSNMSSAPILWSDLNKGIHLYLDISQYILSY